MRFLAILLLTSQAAFAVLPAGADWDARPTATSGNVNGGFFNAARGGTDYSQQDAAQLTYVDGTASGGTTFSSVAGGFTDAMKGNGIHITASTGLTVGWYEIVSVTDANNVELDRTPGTGTATTFYVGGALILCDDTITEMAVGGNDIYIKTGSYTLAASIATAATAATATINIRVIGYTSTHGDVTTGSNRPSINTGSANSWTAAANWQFHNLFVFGTGALNLTVGANSLVVNCKLLVHSTSAARTALTLSGAGSRVLNCDISSLAGVGVSSSGANHYIQGCYIHDSDIGLSLTSAGYTVSDCLFENCKTAGFTASSTLLQAYIENCTFYGANATPIGTGFRTSGTASLAVELRNSIFYGLATNISIHVQQDCVRENFNDFNNNTEDRFNITDGANSITTNPAFAGAVQIVGSTATTSGQVLTQSGGDFSTVTDGVDSVRIVSGTGVTVGTYRIASHTGTTITTTENSFGTSSGGDVVYVIYTGHNFTPTATLAGFPGVFNGNSESTSFHTIGAIQKNATAGGEHSHTF